MLVCVMMAETTFSKRKLSINVSFLNLTKQTSSQKSPKTFNDPNGVVGLQILAALNNNHDDHRHRQDSIFIGGFSSISPKSPSNPIPILTTKKSFEKNLSTEAMELCEEYTCVVSHAGDKSIKEIDYFEADLLGNNEGCKRVFVVSSNSGTFGGNDGDNGGGFLRACFLCDKMLDGLDIFMYRGEKAFCSVECRCKQISIDERKEEKRNRSKMRKPMDCCSVSPCSTSPMHFFAGVAAA